MMSTLFCLAARFLSTILFLGASVGLFSWKYTSKSEVEDRPMSVGLQTRGSFVNCWCVAHLVRGCSSGAQIFTCSGTFCARGRWDCQLLRGLADVPFCSSYLLFVLFLGHVNYTASGRTFPRLMPVFFLCNGAFYAVVIALAAKCLASETHANLYGRMVFNSIGLAYVACLGLLLHFGRGLRTTLTAGVMIAPPELIGVATRFGALVAAVFVCQAVHYFSWTSRSFEAYLTHRGHTTCHGICATDFALNLGLEFLPTLAGFALLRQGARRRPPVAASPRYQSIV